VTRDQVTIKLPAGFNADLPAHREAVQKAIEAQYGEGWVVDSFDTSNHTASATRQASVAVTQEVGDETVEVRLPSSMRTPTSGVKAATLFEDKYKDRGLTMTRFDPYIGSATLEKVPADVLRARGAVADAVGVKPWEIYAKRRRGGGFEVELKSYMPSKHYAKLTEVATTIIGKPGWYIQVDTKTNVMQIIPADLPTFEPMYPFPFDDPADDLFSIPLGEALGGMGVPNHTQYLDLDGSSGCLAVGVAGMGKSVFTMSIIFSLLKRGYWLGLINAPQKATDFMWAKEYVHENWWGCDSSAEAATVAKLVHQEGVRRGELLKQYDATKWQELPADVREANPLIVLIADELAAQLQKEPEPKALPKDHPDRVAVVQANLESDILQLTLSKIPAEMRAAGIRVFYITQQAQLNFGIGPKMKVNLPHRLLLGSKPSAQQKTHAFQVPEKVPDVPEYISSDDMANKGVGITEFEGQEPSVFKGYFAKTSEYLAHLQKLSRVKTSHPKPTPAQVSACVPRLDDADEVTEYLSDTSGFGQDGRDVADRDTLKGAAKAAHDSALAAAMAAKGALGDD